MQQEFPSLARPGSDNRPIMRSEYLGCLLLAIPQVLPACEFCAGMQRPDFSIETPLASLSTVDLGGSAALEDPPVAFNITINYSGDPAFQPAFNQAVATWQALMPFYLDGRQGSNPIAGLVITASVANIDGPGGILGSAGPQTGSYDNSGYLLARTGQMTFDSSDFSSPTGSFQNVVLHEMAHVIGIGTLWGLNGLYNASAPAVNDPNNGQSVGQYTGFFGLQGWQAEFDADATYVPIEKGGGSGTANGHWNEGDGGTATGYVSNITGLDSRFELMTGWLNSGSFISELTKGGLRDLGYDVVVIPEPAWMSLAGFAGLACTLRRRRA